MELIQVAVAVLSLLSVGQSAPATGCESLIQPLEVKEREQLLGKWIHAAESRDNPNAEQTQRYLSLWIKITAANKSDSVIFMGSSEVDSICVAIAFKVSLENNTLRLTNETFGHYPETEFPPIKFLKTGCSDCLLLQPPDNTFQGTVRSLMLLSKTGNVTAAELEEFKKQAECLKLQPPFSLKPGADECPEPPPEDTENIDIPRFFFNGELFKFENFFGNIFSAAGGPDSFHIFTVITFASLFLFFLSE